MSKRTISSSTLELPRIFERPDGFYWQAAGGGPEYGPFASRLDAEVDGEGPNFGEGGPESLQEAESEIGIADWIDPETGQPAEESVPHLEDDVV